MIAAGRLNHRVTIAVPTYGPPDSRGTRPLDWNTKLTTVWACIEPLNPKWAEQAKAIAPTVSHRITIRSFGITTRHRVELGNRIFAINAVLDPKESKEDTVLYCTEKLS